MVRKIFIIILYIAFLVCCSFVLKEELIGLISFIYLFLGFTGLYLYNRYQKLFITSLDYLFTFYEFMVLLLASNEGWRRDFLSSDYRKMSLFIFLLFSFPTLFYIVDKFLQKFKKSLR